MPSIEINEYDVDKCVANTFSVNLTVDQISEIVSYAPQLIVEYRSQRNLDYIDELYESLVDAEILSST